jgi:hypothetical protein
VIASGDLIAIETAGGNSRKVTADRAGLAAGTSFPGSPASGDVFRRTDRNIEYVYDGTQWLSDLRSLQSSTTTISVSTGHFIPVPWKGIYSIYLDHFEATTNRTGTGEWDVELYWLASNVAATLLASIDGAGDSATTVYNKTADISSVLSGSAVALYPQFTEVSGTSSIVGGTILWYRLVG